MQFDKPGVVLLGCNIHDWMSAYIVVVDTPYFATVEDGRRVSLANVEAGQYTVRLWYPEMREEPKPIAVTVGANDTAAVSFAGGK